MAALSVGQSCFSSMLPPYNPHFNTGTAYTACNMFCLQSSVVSPSAMSCQMPAMSPLSSATTLESNTSGLGCLSIAPPSDHSPGRRGCSESPTTALCELSATEHSPPDTACSGGYYSSASPPSSPEDLTSSIVNGGHSLPLPSLSYPTAPLYSSQDYSPASLSSSVPMPMWSPYPSLPNVGPLPSPSLPKLSYDSPRYKLTPERAIPLIKWFEEHKEHPYPTRQEKIILCQSTQLTFTQVSTWFANARRRMKKALSEDLDEDSHGSSSESDNSNNSTVTRND